MSAADHETAIRDVLEFSVLDGFDEERNAASMALDALVGLLRLAQSNFEALDSQHEIAIASLERAEGLLRQTEQERNIAYGQKAMLHDQLETAEAALRQTEQERDEAQRLTAELIKVRDGLWKRRLELVDELAASEQEVERLKRGNQERETANAVVEEAGERGSATVEADSAQSEQRAPNPVKPRSLTSPYCDEATDSHHSSSRGLGT